ncbi:MAG: hypothetical protein JNL82_10945 [Myxococcales bacterium]|nr:hypothetical protein [Myxococcales bacterium]
MSPRRRRILFALCRAYIATGRPVASATLSRHLECSSATIRSELAALEEHGLLHQAHHSAGRVPTAAGMRLYVQALGALPPPSAEVRRAVDVALPELVHGPEGMRTATQVLSELVGCVAVTFVAPGRRGVMRHLDLVPVQGARALVVVGLGEGEPLVHPVTLDPRVAGDPAGLVRLQERLRSLCTGKTLAEARADLTRLWSEHEARVDRLLAESLRLGLWLCSAIAQGPLWMQIAGQRLLAESALPATLAQMLALFDDYHALAELLCQLLPEPVGAPRAEVLVGTHHYAPPAGPYAPPAGHYAPPAGPYAPPAGHYAPPAGHYAPPAGHYAPPAGHYAPPAGHYAPPAGPYAPPGHLAPSSGHLAPSSGHLAAPAGGSEGPLTPGTEVDAGRPGVPAGLSLVGCRSELHASSGMITAVAMLGPDRMDYEAVIPLVEYAARALAARASE